MCTHGDDCLSEALCVGCVREKMGVENNLCLKSGYIHKDLRCNNDDEIAQLRKSDLKNFVQTQKKLHLVLDLDHTLLHSIDLSEICTKAEDSVNMLAKLRPYVPSFLKEANRMFQLYIYTMGNHNYASYIADFLDPHKAYFTTSRVISKDESTQISEKGLDLLSAHESSILILDDNESVWRPMDRDNLMLMKKYKYFPSSCLEFATTKPPKSDESETDGPLARVLKILKRVHSMYFSNGEDDRDVRSLLKTIRKEILEGCTIVFSHVVYSGAELKMKDHPLWKMAEKLGATCSVELNPSVTHAISTHIGTEESRWAIREKKFLISPQWIEAANLLWQKQSEEEFAII